ncbi:MAG: DUF4349 domain-containing protein [Chloroflexota bacterium]
MKRKKAVLIAVGGLAMVTLLAGYPILTSLPQDQAELAPFTGEGSAGEVFSKTRLNAPAPVTAAIGAPAESVIADSGRMAATAAAPASQDASGWSDMLMDQKIIRNATISITAKDVTTAIDQVSDIVVTHTGAFIASSNIRQNEEKSTATIVIKIPAPFFEQALKQLRQVGNKVTGETVSSQDVTEQYIDLESQLRNLKATEERYLQLLTKAYSIQDILSIQERLNSVRSQIERAQGRLRFLEQRAALSTITVNLSPWPASGITKGRWDPAKTLNLALGNLAKAMQGAMNAAIYVTIYALPLLPVAVFAYWLLRRRRPGGPVAQA